MCIFSRDVSEVANTRIFARSAGDGRQFLVYSMQYQADSDLAMILPLPTPVSSPEDAVRFIDFSDYPNLFDDLWAAANPLCFGSDEPDSPLPASIKVHEVGSFQASFVPHLRDFARLDAIFRLPEQIWDQLPDYADYGFAVFKLRAGAKDIHPMAFEFPRRHPKELFFPTVHVHDGKVEETAKFHHILFCQTPEIQPKWHMSSESPTKYPPFPAGLMVNCAKTHGVVDPELFVQMKILRWMHPNKDIVIQENH